MPLTVTELLNPRTRDQIADDLFAALSAAGFPVTAWQSGAVPRTLVFVYAAVLATLWGLIAQVAGAAFLATATGAWLTLHAKSRFALDRIAATFARHSVTLVNASASPVTIAPGQLVLTTSAGTVRFRSTNIVNVIVPGSGTAGITVMAETAGIAGNTSPAVLVTPATAGLGFTWGSLSTMARNEESDAELRVRCLARWAVLGSGFTRDAVVYWCTSALFADGTSVGCTRVGFGAVPGDGSYVVYVAGATGPLGSLGRARVQVVLDLRKPITDTPQVTDATTATLAVSGTVQFKAGLNTSANRSAVETAIRAYVNGKGIGDAAGIDLGALYAAIYRAVPDGFEDVDLSSPSGDVAVAAGAVAVPDVTGLSYS